MAYVPSARLSLAHPEYDFVVVGAGSAGSMLASRLARSFHVGLVEAGQSKPGSVFMRRPADFLKTFDTPDDWSYWTIPQAKLGGRSIRFPRGRGLGGSTRINASIWLPPTQSDLVRLRCQLGETVSLEALHATLRQVTEQVTPELPRWLSQPAFNFIAAAEQLGFTAHAYQRMNRRGVRLTAAEATLDSSVSAPEIITNAIAQRLVLKSNRVNAVEIETPHGHAVLQTKFGVVLATGAIGSPALLLRSEIRSSKPTIRTAHSDENSAEPQSHEIGSGLRDHLVIPVVYRTKKNVSLPTTWDPSELARWRALGTGPVTGNIAEAGCLIETPQGPLQLFVTATNYLKYPNQASEPALSFGIVVSTPQSVGTLRLATDASPVIDPGYWTCEKDALTAFMGLQIVRKLAHTGPLAELCEEETFPGKRADTLANFMRIASRGAQSLYHPVGTCGQGPTETSPVGTDFRLRGVDGLWVADASVLGFIPMSNPNPLIMSLASLASQRIERAV